MNLADLRTSVRQYFGAPVPHLELPTVLEEEERHLSEPHAPAALTGSAEERLHAVLERRLVGDKNRLKALTMEMSADVSPRWAADQRPDLNREEIVDIRGMAQVVTLFEHCGDEPPVFVAQEVTLTEKQWTEYFNEVSGTGP